MTRIIVYHVESCEKDVEAYIYLYEHNCGHTPHEPFEEFDNLHDALKYNKGAMVLRFPGEVF